MELLLVGGPNGSGKIMLLRERLRGPQLRLLSAHAPAEDPPPADPARARVRAGRLFLSTLRDAVARGESIAIETTLAGRTLAGTLRRARDRGCRIHVCALGEVLAGSAGWFESTAPWTRRRAGSRGRCSRSRDERRTRSRKRAGGWGAERLLHPRHRALRDAVGSPLHHGSLGGSRGRGSGSLRRIEAAAAIDRVTLARR